MQYMLESLNGLVKLTIKKKYQFIVLGQRIWWQGALRRKKLMVIDQNANKHTESDVGGSYGEVKTWPEIKYLQKIITFYHMKWKWYK